MTPDVGVGPSRDPLLEFIRKLNVRLASQLEPNVILAGIVEDTAALLGAEEGCIRLLGPEDTVGHTVVRKAAHSGSWPRAVATSVTGFLAADNPLLVTGDLVTDPRFSLRGVDTRVRSVLAVPLTLDGRMAGVLAVSNSQPGRVWTDQEVQTLSMVANYSARPLVTIQLRYELHRAKQMEQTIARMEAEMVQARIAQMGLVPSSPLAVAGWQVHGQVVPARRVGGDLFHHFAVGEALMGITVADVEGHGMEAAFTMAMVRGALGEIYRARLPIPDVLNHVGRVVLAQENRRTLTMFYGEFDTGQRTLRYSSAGHPPAVVRRVSGRMEPLLEGGPLFGVFERFDYPVGEVHLEPGDSVLAYTDGVTEAMNPDRDLFGEERLFDVWSACAGQTALEAMGLVHQAIGEFRGAAEQNDDITLLVLNSVAG